MGIVFQRFDDQKNPSVKLTLFEQHVREDQSSLQY